MFIRSEKNEKDGIAECGQAFPFNSIIVTKSKYSFPPGAPNFQELRTDLVVPGLERAKSSQTLPYIVSPNIRKSDSLVSVEDTLSEVTDELQVEKIQSVDQIRSHRFNYQVDKILDDPYDEEIAEVKYLRSTPVSFMVMGKPCMEFLKVAQKLATYWGCVCIDPETCLNAELAIDTDLSAWCKQRLRQGLTIPSTVVMRIMEKYVLTDKVNHCGYVLYGLPFVPEENDASVQEQLDMIFNWAIKPTVFIYITCPDQDLFTKVHQLYYDYNTGLYINKNVFKVDMTVRLVYTMDKRNMVNEDIMDIYEEIRQEKDLLSDSSYKHLVQIPGFRLMTTLQRFRSEVLPVLENILAHMDPQFVIKVDGRTTPVHMFRIVKARLDVLPLRLLHIPLKLTGEKESQDMAEEASEEEVEEEENKNAASAFTELKSKNLPDPRFKWQMSHWHFLCPVALLGGKAIEGSPEYPLRFLDKIYFLSSPEAAESFAINPRTYLLPPNPRPVCKIFVMGPSFSGKTAVSLYLSQVFDGKVIAVEPLLKKEKDSYELSQLEELKQVVHENAKITLTEKFKETWKQEMEVWKNKVLEWREKNKNMVQSLLEMDQEESEDAQLPDEDEAKQIVSEDKEPTKEEEPDIPKEVKEVIPYLPFNLTMPPPPREIGSEDEPYFNEQIEKAVLEFKENPPELPLSLKGSQLVEHILDAQAERLLRSCGVKIEGGWVLDDFPLEVDLWNYLKNEGLLPEAIILLKDTDPEYSFLVDKWKDYYLLKEPEFGRLHPGYVTTESLMAMDPNYTKTDSAEKTTPEGELEKVEEEEELVIEVDTIMEEEEMTGIQEVDAEAAAMEEEKDKYFQNLEEFYNEWEELKESLPVGPLVLEVSLNGKAVSVLLAEIAQKLEGHYRLHAETVGDEDVEEEAEAMSQDNPTDLDEEEEAEESKQKNRLLGDTGSYCPVAFRDHHVLWPGKDLLVAKYRDKIYTFSSEEAMEAFMEKPWKFAPHRKPVGKLPPLRICLVGPAGSGTTTVGKCIAKLLGLIHKDFEDDVDTILTPPSVKPVGRKREADEGEQEELEVAEEGNVTEEQETTDIRGVLIQYLKEGMPVPEQLVPLVLKPLWDSEPFFNTGFVYSGFPMHPQDIDILKQNYLIPDIIICIMVEDSELVVERLLPKFMLNWQTRIDAEKKKAADKYAADINTWKEAVQLRKEQLLKELRGNQEGDNEVEDEYDTESEIGERSEYEEEEEELLQKVEEMLSEELPMPVKEAREWETRSEAKERFTGTVQEWFDADIENLETLKTLVEEEKVFWLEVNGSASVKDVYNEIMYHIFPYKSRSHAMFESTFSLSMYAAEKMLKTGYLFPSKFGRWCPVQVAERKVPIQVFKPFSEKQQIFPVAHRKYVYFLAGESNRDAFMKNPLKYEDQDAYLPIIPVKIAIVGPPKCGKSTLAEQLAKTLGLRVITAGQAVRYVLDELQWTELAEKVLHELVRGKCVPITLLVRCVEAATINPRAATQGYILDGFPNTAKQVREMNTIHSIPYLVIELECSLFTCLERLEKLMRSSYSGYPAYSPEILQHKYTEWMCCAVIGLKYMRNKFHNVISISGEKSVWFLHKHAEEEVHNVMSSILTYFINVKQGKAAKLDRMCVTGDEFLVHQSTYKSYCPVCLKLNNYRTYGEFPPLVEGLVQYLSHYYWVCNTHLPLFLEYPSEFVLPENTATLPTHLPMVVKGVTSEEDVEYNGFCIVMYSESLPKRLLVKGMPEYCVQYKGLKYLFANAECQDRFLQDPEYYISFEIRLPLPDMPPLQISGLPCMGYLEQETTVLLNKAVSCVGFYRPKYPGLDMRLSGAIYLGYSLKLLNPETPAKEIEMFTEARNLFMNRCKLLKRMFQSTKKRNPYLPIEDSIKQSQ